MRCIIVCLAVVMGSISILTGITNVTNAQVWEEWIAVYNGPGNGSDDAAGITIDQDGFIYVTGTGVRPETGNDYVTIKYSPDGIEQWISYYNHVEPSYNGADGATALVVDSIGNVYVTGISIGYWTWHDGATVKYNSSGEEQWVSRYSDPINDSDKPIDIDIDYQGSVVIAGWGAVLATYSTDYLTVKYNNDGIEQWVATYNGPPSWPDYIRDLEIDCNGNIYVTGESDSTNIDYCTIKYNPNGVEQWIVRYNGPNSENNSDQVSALALDQNGNVYLTGSTFGGSIQECITVKYNHDGVEQWTAGVVDGAGLDIVVDEDGNAYISGWYSNNISNLDYLIVKYDSIGVEQWSATYNGPGNNLDKAYYIAIDEERSVYVTGISTGLGFDYDYATVKYDSSGVEQWVTRYNSPSNGEDFPAGIALDEDRNVYVTGISNDNIVTIKYCQITPDVSITLTPLSTTTFPAVGGVLEYNIAGANNGGSSVSLDIWVDVTLPDSSLFGPVLGPVQDFTMPAGFSTDRDRELTIPGGAPAGTYSLNGYLGIYDEVNPTLYTEDHFNFFKEGASDQCISDWFIDSGEEFTTDHSPVSSELLPSSFFLLTSHPNPFNPSTTLSFDLPSGCSVELNIYNVTGCQVASLLDGWRESGTHTVTFDASNLPSGIYIARLEAGDYQASQKLVLLK